MADHRHLDRAEARARIEHEDKWIQHRVSWLLASTAFLTAAFSVLVTADVVPNDPKFGPIAFLILCLPFAGFAFSSLVLIGYVAAQIAMQQLKQAADPPPTARRRSQTDFPLRSEGCALWLGIASSGGSIIASVALWTVLMITALVLVF